jgi:hypothetical protein
MNLWVEYEKAFKPFTANWGIGVAKLVVVILQPAFPFDDSENALSRTMDINAWFLWCIPTTRVL